MKITTATPRRHIVNAQNDVITLYNHLDDGYGAPREIPCYTEFSIAGMERKYGIGTRYKGLIIIDGPTGYVDEGAVAPFFTLKVGDKLLPYGTGRPFEDIRAEGEGFYTVMDVAVNTMHGALLTVEVLCG